MRRPVRDDKITDRLYIGATRRVMTGFDGISAFIACMGHPGATAAAGETGGEWQRLSVLPRASIRRWMCALGM